LIVACPPMRSNVNLSRIVRTAGCCGVRRMIVCGAARVDRSIARDGADEVAIEVHRTLPPVLRELKAEGHVLCGLEQATGSECLHEFRFPRRSVLVVGNERSGLTDEVLALLDHVLEIPVWGLPHAYNAATAADMALYEYCRQHPRG
jgi:tRNA G18 (ribose-2'-O)-methylase SpoU